MVFFKERDDKRVLNTTRETSYDYKSYLGGGVIGNICGESKFSHRHISLQPTAESCLCNQSHSRPSPLSRSSFPISINMILILTDMIIANILVIIIITISAIDTILDNFNRIPVLLTKNNRD